MGKDELVSVLEKDTCNYIVNVHTSLLCNIPLFKSKRYGKEVPVVCSPVVSEDAYQAHLRKQGNRGLSATLGTCQTILIRRVTLFQGNLKWWIVTFQGLRLEGVYLQRNQPPAGQK